MKIKITYQPEERRQVRLLLSFIKGLMSIAEIRFPDSQVPCSCEIEC